MIRRPKIALACLGLALLSLSLATGRGDAAPACTTTFTGGGGTAWATAANWDNGLPGATSHACIPSGKTAVHSTGTDSVFSIQVAGSLTVSGGTLNLTDTGNDSNVASLTQSGGTIGGVAKLNVTGNFAWSSGTMGDAGTTAIAAAATVTQTGFPVLANGRALDNAGTYEIQGNFSLNTSGTAPLLHNSGTLTKTSGTGAGTIFVPLANDGAVRSNTGTLNLSGGGGPDSGSFGAAAAVGTVSFLAGTHTLGNGASLLGSVTIAGGTVTVPNGAAVTASGANLFSGGTLNGTGTVTVASGSLTWSGGTMGEAGTTAIAAGATVAQTGFPVLANGRKLDNAGTYEIQGNFSVNTSGTAPLLHNSGTLTKTSGTGAGTIFVPLANDGAVRSNAGTLNLSGGGTHSGSFGGPAATGTVSFLAGTNTYNGATLLGSVTIAGGTLTVPNGQTLTASGANTFSGGTLNGTGSFNIADGTLTWSGGTMTDAGTTAIAAGATVNQTGSNILSNGRTLDNAGSYALQGNNISLNTSGSPTLLHNSGTITRTSGTGEASIWVPLANAGTVGSTAGKLNLRSGAATPQSGTFTGVSDSSRPAFAGGTFTLGAGVSLDGTVEIGGATVGIAAGTTLAVDDRLLMTGGSLTGPGDVRVTGTLVWTGGNQTAPGTTDIRAGGELDVDALCTVSLAGGRVLHNSGTVTLLHNSRLIASGATQPTIDNEGTITLDDSGASCAGFGGLLDTRVVNEATGTITKMGSSNASSLDGIENAGLVQVTAGRLDLSGTAGASQTGRFGSAGIGSTLAFAEGTFQMAAGASLFGQTAITGADVKVEDGATLTVAAPDVLTMSDGTFGGAGTLNVLGHFAWSGGYHVDSGTTAIGPGATATIDGASFDVGLDEGRALVNRGTIDWTGGDMWLGNGSSLVNGGTITMSGDSFFGGGGFSGWGYGSLFHNAGLLRKTGATTADLDVPVDNDGTFEVVNGTLAVRGQLLNYGAAAKSLTAGAYVIHDGATLELPSFTNTGEPAIVALNASTLVLDGPTSRIVYSDPFDPTGATKLDALKLAANAGAGEFVLDGGRTLTTAGPLRNSGVLTVRGTSTLTTTGAYTQTGGITNLASPSARLTASGDKAQVNGGRFGGIGSVGPELSVGSGEVQPGLGAPGILSADALTAGGGSTLRMQIGGSTAGADYDRLAVTGAAALDGTLAIETAPGFHPVEGDTFTIVTYASRTGTFSSVSGTDLGGGLHYDVLYSATDVTLKVSSAAGPPPPPRPGPPPPVTPGPTRTIYDDGSLTVLRGPWARRTGSGFFDSTYTVSSKRGSSLVRAGEIGRRFSLLAMGCRRCGTIAVSWNGVLLRRINLRHSGAAKLRLYPLARFHRLRTGTLTLRIVSRGRPVMVDAFVVDRR